jgi:hypothetical protein
MITPTQNLISLPSMQVKMLLIDPTAAVHSAGTVKSSRLLPPSPLPRKAVNHNPTPGPEAARARRKLAAGRKRQAPTQFGPSSSPIHSPPARQRDAHTFPPRCRFFLSTGRYATGQQPRRQAPKPTRPQQPSSRRPRPHGAPPRLAAAVFYWQAPSQTPRVPSKGLPACLLCFPALARLPLPDLPLLSFLLLFLLLLPPQSPNPPPGRWRGGRGW